MENAKPKVTRAGMGIMIQNDKGEVLLGLRNSDGVKADSDLHGEGTWTFPGGKFDFGDGLFEGAAREVLEETGIVLKKVEIASISNERVDTAHYVTLGFRALEWEGEPKVMEPEEIVEWKWFALDALPKNIFPPTRKMIENVRAGVLCRDLED
jgi:8-oxo-dGTP pyrophosphatase MutT (NUDIX family)